MNVELLFVVPCLWDTRGANGSCYWSLLEINVGHSVIRFRFQQEHASQFYKRQTITARVPFLFWTLTCGMYHLLGVPVDCS